MLQIAYIAKLNHTNSLILNILKTQLDAHVVMVEHKSILDEDVSSPKINPDLVFFDLNTSVDLQNAPEKVKAVCKYYPDIPLIVIHPYSTKKFVKPLIGAGADGIIPIDPSEKDIMDAVRETMDGNNFISFSS